MAGADPPMCPPPVGSGANPLSMGKSLAHFSYNLLVFFYLLMHILYMHTFCLYTLLMDPYGHMILSKYFQNILSLGY